MERNTKSWSKIDMVNHLVTDMDMVTWAWAMVLLFVLALLDHANFLDFIRYCAKCVWVAFRARDYSWSSSAVFIGCSIYLQLPAGRVCTTAQMSLCWPLLALCALPFTGKSIDRNALGLKVQTLEKSIPDISLLRARGVWGLGSGGAKVKKKLQVYYVFI